MTTTCEKCENRYDCKLYMLCRAQPIHKPKDEKKKAKAAFHTARLLGEKLLDEGKITFGEHQETMLAHEEQLKNLGVYF